MTPKRSWRFSEALAEARTDPDDRDRMAAITLRLAIIYARRGEVTGRRQARQALHICES